MDTLLSLKVLKYVVESGSFTRAAEQLGISTAMASKHIAHLEQRIQVKLLHRNSRNLHLTEAGEHYFRESCYALETLENAAHRAAQCTEQPQGVLKITMPIWFSNHLVASWLAEYHRLYPQVKLDISLDNKHRNLIADGYDLALRVSNTPAPSLIVRPLSTIRFCLVASPHYLSQHSPIHQPDDLAHHHAVLPSYTNNINTLRFTHTQNHISQDVSFQSHIISNNTLMIHQLVLAHAGLAYLPEWLVQQDIQEQRLIHILPEYQADTHTLYAAYVDRVFLSAKIRSFIDFMVSKTQSATIE